jgi:hypothetical protein
MSEQRDRIVALQKQLKIARDTLNRIAAGSRDPELAAVNALDELWKLDRKQPLQGLVGHERRAR